MRPASPILSRRCMASRWARELARSICVNRADYCRGAPAHSHDAAAQEGHCAGAKGQASKSTHVALAADGGNFVVATRFEDAKRSADASSTDVTRWEEN